MEETNLPDETKEVIEITGWSTDTDGNVSITTQKNLENVKTASKVPDGDPVVTKLLQADLDALNAAKKPVLDPILLAIGEGTYGNTDAPAQDTAPVPAQEGEDSSSAAK